MSRTNRFIPFWARNDYTNWELTRLGIDENYVAGKDPRDALKNGYDGVSQSYYYNGFPTKGWRENYQRKTRMFFKRKYHKQFRQQQKQEIRGGED